MKNWWAELVKDEGGQSMIEYGVIASLIVVALVFTVKSLRDKVVDVFNAIKDALVTVTTS